MLFLVESAVGITLFYAVYYVILRNSNSYHFNRFYLLFSLLFSLAITQIQLPDSQVAKHWQIIELAEVEIYAQTLAEPEKYLNNSIYTIALIIYYSISSALLIRFIYHNLQLVKLIKSGERVNYFGKKVIRLTSQKTVFSFGSYIFMNPDDYSPYEFNTIFAHESVHNKQLHSIDKLIIELFSIVFWFNPIVWLLKNSLTKTHEYLADEGVIEQGFDSSKYKLLLLNQSVGRFFALANNFNQSLTLKRLEMMNQTKKTYKAVFKVLVISPILAILLIFSCTEANTQMITEKTAVESNTTDNIYETADVMPEFEGGQEALFAYIAGEIKYPPEALKNGVTGKIFIQFVISETGTIDEATVVRADVKDLTGEPTELNKDLLEAEALRVILAMPDWTPGTIDNKPVKVSFAIPLKFAIDEEKKK